MECFISFSSLQYHFQENVDAEFLGVLSPMLLAGEIAGLQVDLEVLVL